MGKKLPARLEALAIARTQLGVREHPAGSNWGPQVRLYLKASGIHFPAPWCAAFVTWCLTRAGYKVTTPGPAAVESWVQWAEKHGHIVSRPLRGDLICYQWDAGWYDHIGFVERVLALRWRSRVFVGYVQTIEGNTTAGKRGDQSNGDGVYRRRRWIRSAKFVRLPDVPLPKEH